MAALPGLTSVVKERMDLLGLLRKRGSDGDVDFLREALRVLVEGIMDAEVSARIGAEYGGRSPERVTQRNGYLSRAWDTRVWTMDLRIPKLREGSYFPSLLEPRHRSERALLAVIAQGGDRHGLCRGQLAAMPHPLHDQPAYTGAQAGPAVGGHHGPHRLPSTFPRGGARPSRQGDRSTRRPVPSGRLGTGRGWSER